MIPAFFTQYAAGCFLAVGATAIRLTDWRYVRLMCIVSCAVAILALAFHVVELANPASAITSPAAILLTASLACGFAWLFVNAAQGERLRDSQRWLAALAGLTCLAAALLPSHSSAESTLRAASPIAVIASTVLGAALLGVATTAMLLGHRYLTDTGMSISPLKRLTTFYLIVLAARLVFAGVQLASEFFAHGLPPTTRLYLWLALAVRCGVGLVVAGIFGWMIWDCVRRRATQSATALYYLSMLFVLTGELSAQYLLHYEGIAL